MENKITNIQGLEACTRLQELYLYSNRITAITGLDHLTQLQVTRLSGTLMDLLWSCTYLQQGSQCCGDGGSS